MGGGRTVGWMLLIGAAGVLVLGGVVGAESGWEGFVVAHLQRYPLAAPEDVYKFVHQSVFGPAHFIDDSDSARAYLSREIAGLRPGAPDEPLVEELSDSLLRVNLRPFVASGGDEGGLVTALVESANTVKGDPETMSRRLGQAVRTLRELGRGDDAGRLSSIGAELAGRGYPALHHSERYTAAYHPAYRVVLRATFPRAAR